MFMTDDLEHVESVGRTPTKSRFKQYNKQGTECLDEWRATFVETQDPTEYKAAIALCGSWATWDQFKSNWPHFKSIILPQWHMELEMRIRSEAMQNIIVQSKTDKGTAAAKFIVEGKHCLRKYVIDDNAKTKNQEINGALAREFEADFEIIRQAEIDSV